MRSSLISSRPSSIGTEERSPIKIELAYSPPTGNARETLRLWHTKDQKDAWAFEKNTAHRNRLITAILDLTAQRAETEGTRERRMFRVVIHQAGGDRMPVAFSVLPTYDGADAALASDDTHGEHLVPTTSGTLQAVLKQNHQLHKSILKRAQQDERLMGGIATMINSLTKHQSEHQSHLWDRIETLEDQRVKAIEIVEEARTLSHDRMIEEKVVSADQERKSAAMDMFKTIGEAISVSFARW